MIFIYSKENDEFVNDVIRWINSSSSFIRLSSQNNSKTSYLSINNDSLTSIEVSNSFLKKAQIISADTIISVWFNGATISYYQNESEELNKLLNKNTKLVIDGFLDVMPNISLGSIDNNIPNNKIQSLIQAKKVGLKVPDTLITENKNELFTFFHLKKESIICKRINAKSIFKEGSFVFNINSVFELNQKMFELLPNSFGLSLFQENIEKEYEIRTILFDGAFYSSAIFETIKSVDYRSSLTGANPPRIVPYKLPKSIEDKLFKLMNFLGYSVGSIDMIYNSTSEYVFLEINPVGQISFINNFCNYYLDEKFAIFLSNFKNEKI